MDVAAFVKLSTRVCDELRVWIEEARGRAVLSEGQLLTLSDAADVIRQATTTLAGSGGEADAARANEELEERAFAAADEAGSAFLPRDRVLNSRQDD